MVGVLGHSRRSKFVQAFGCCLGLVILVLPYGRGTAQDVGVRPELNGVWMPTHVSLEDSRWRIEDLACGGMCSLPQFEYLQSLLRNPENDSRSVKDLYYHSYEYHLEHSIELLTPEGKARIAEYRLDEGAALDCSPDGDGWSTQLFAPLPSKIEQYDDKVVIRYEYWNAVRTIYLDGREPPPDEPLTRLGYSIGHYDGDALLVDTTRLLPGELYVPAAENLVALMLSEDAVGTERYSLSADGERLDLVWSISDPVYLSAPVKGQKSVLLARDWELEEFICESTTGEY